MSVVGVGVDMIELARVEQALSRSPRLATRVFTERELAVCTAECGRLQTGGLAARFAAKEAVAKAFGTGVRGFAFRDIEVLPDTLGKPEVTLHARAAELAERLGIGTLHVSLSMTDELAVANVVAAGRDEGGGMP